MKNLIFEARKISYLAKDIIFKLSQKSIEEKFGIDEFLDISFFTTPNEMETEVSESDMFEIVDHAGVDSINSMIPEQLNEMTEMQWEQWCEFNYETCKETTIIGMSSHGLLICKKIEKSAR